MKIIFISIFFLISGIIYSQNSEKTTANNFHYTLSFGITNCEGYKTGPSIRFEISRRLMDNFDYLFSIGYARVYKRESYLSNTYSVSFISGDSVFSGLTSSIYQKNFDALPISLGIKYKLMDSGFRVYVAAEGIYEFIDAEYYKTATDSYPYHSYNDLPPIYKSASKISLEHSSNLCISASIGASAAFYKSFRIDLRLSYKRNINLPDYYCLLIGFML